MKFPIGGKVRERAGAGFGEIPKPTVQSGWKKMTLHSSDVYSESGCSCERNPGIVFTVPGFFILEAYERAFMIENEGCCRPLCGDI